jgi:serine/threonine protein kinase
MAYLHEHNIVHRDLKLDNILIDPSDKNRIKIIDFGFSIKATAEQKLTLFCGTPHYMDPDISRKRDYNGHAADVWALGVILFILLTGKLPFFGEYEQDLYRKIQAGKFQFPQAQVPADRSSYMGAALGGVNTQTQRYHEPPVISQ